MPIDPITDRLLTFREATTLFPRRRRGTKVNIATLWRWTTAGARGVVLETVRIGNQNYTTEQAIRDFVAAQSRPCPAPSMPAPNTIKRLETLGL